MRAGELQPQQRTAHEQIGRHQMRLHAIGEHHQMKADQPHVVGQRHPRQADVVRVEARDRGDCRGCWPCRLACVSTTPLGSLVEPEENWMKATSPGRARCSLPLRPSCSSSSTRNARARSDSISVPRRRLRGEAGEALEQAPLGVDIRAPSLRAMRSSLWRCSSLMPGATGTAMMPPSSAAQKASMNGSLSDRNRISLSPGRAPRRCR